MYNNNDPLKIAKDALDKAIETEKRNRKLIESIGPAVISALAPLFSQLQTAISRLKVDVSPIVQVNPEIKIPPITIPPIKYTPPDVIVNYTPPKIDVSVPKPDLSGLRIPDIKWPQGEMKVAPIRLADVDLSHPLPVQLRDAKGNPVTLGVGGSAIVGGGNSGGNVVVQNDTAHPVPVTITSGSGSTTAAVPTNNEGLTYNSDNPLPISLASGSLNSVNIAQFNGNTAVSGGGYQDNAIRVVHATDAVASVVVNNLFSAVADTGGGEGVSNALRVVQASGSVVSVNVVADAINLDQTTDSISVRQVSGFTDSVNVSQVGGNVVVVGTGYQDNALRVVHATDAIVSVNIVGENQTLEVLQISGSIFSTNMQQTAGNSTVVGGGWKDNALRVVEAQDSITSSNIMQVNGSSVVVGTGYQDNALRMVNATDAITSVNLNTVNGSGVVVGSGYQDNALRVVNATDAITSVNIVGENVTLEVLQVSGAINSVQSRLIARQTNPTATSDNTSNFQTSDDLGRAINTPIQVRDLIATAYATFATGTEATLLAGVAATYLDLIYILASNNSTAAVGIDIRPSTAGSIIMHLDIPANGVAGVSPPRPIPQQATGDGTGGSWTVDLPDITGTIVSVSALFSKEV